MHQIREIHVRVCIVQLKKQVLCRDDLEQKISISERDNLKPIADGKQIKSKIQIAHNSGLIEVGENLCSGLLSGSRMRRWTLCQIVYQSQLAPGEQRIQLIDGKLISQQRHLRMRHVTVVDDSDFR